MHDLDELDNLLNRASTPAPETQKSEAEEQAQRDREREEIRHQELERQRELNELEARAKAAKATVNAENFDENEFANFESAQDGLGNSLNRLIVSVENYPDLKANEEYLTLQAQLAGCENRILTERERFNETAKVYNQSIRKFPSNLIANMFDFEKRPYFEAAAGAEKAPGTF